MIYLNYCNYRSEALVLIHFIIMAHAPEKICLPHYALKFNCTSSVVYKKTSNYFIHSLKNNKLQLLFTMLLPYIYQQKYAPQMPHMLISSCAGIRHLCQYVHIISSHHNHECHHKHLYKYISHYWHMPLEKYATPHIHMSHCTNTVVYI